MPELQPTLKVSEIFYSIQGEGPYTGHPFIFVRTFGCNFQCAGFSNPNNSNIASGALSGVLPDQGCDSIYSWHPTYKKTIERYDPYNLYASMLDKLPNGLWVNLTSNLHPILCFTGGEPLLQQAAIGAFIEFLTEGNNTTIETILFETNCSTLMTESFTDILYAWLASKLTRSIVWANSPKLSNSGEPKEKAIRPDVFTQQVSFCGPILRNSVHQYLKFVSDGTDSSFEEIQTVYKLFSATSIKQETFEILKPSSVYVMPEGATLEQQTENQLKVVQQCLTHGWTYCARVHVSIFGNTRGT